MPIIGNLSEFPLPEVLLLIGSRTGRLRLYDVPEFAEMELDLSEGQAHALHLGGSYLTESEEIVAELSVIVESGDGMFEFNPQAIELVRQDDSLPISQLVMLLILHVDEKLAKKRALLAPDLFYRLETPAPEIWIDPSLNIFFQQSRQYLKSGIQAEDLAENLGLDTDVARLNLGYLRQLGFVRVLEGPDLEEIRETAVQKEISQKTSEFQLAAEASDLIRRTGKLLKLPARK